VCSQSTTGLPANCIATVVALVIGGLGAGPGEGERGSQLNAPISTQPVLSEADRLRIQAEERLRYETRNNFYDTTADGSGTYLGESCCSSYPLSAPTQNRPLLPSAFESLSLLVPRFHTLVVRSARSRWLIHNFEKIVISPRSINLPHPSASGLRAPQVKLTHEGAYRKMSTQAQIVAKKV